VAASAESLVAIRHGARYVARLIPARAPRQEEQQPVELTLGSKGMLDSLSFQPATRQKPGPGEGEIQVFATGLNFRDVLSALGEYRGDAGPYGLECAGRVIAVGPGVAQIAVGDDVIALAFGCFRDVAVTLAAFVAPKPKQLSYAAAA